MSYISAPVEWEIFLSLREGLMQRSYIDDLRDWILMEAFYSTKRKRFIHWLFSFLILQTREVKIGSEENFKHMD